MVTGVEAAMLLRIVKSGWCVLWMMERRSAHGRAAREEGLPRMNCDFSLDRRSEDVMG